MMRRGDPVSHRIPFHAIADLHDGPGDFMAQDQRSLVDTVPLHHIASAYPTGLNLYEEFSGSNLGQRHILEAYITVIVIHGYSHSIPSSSDDYISVHGACQ